MLHGHPAWKLRGVYKKQCVHCNYVLHMWLLIMLLEFPAPMCLSFGQCQDTELWNNQFPDSKILGVPVSWLMSALVYTMLFSDKADTCAFHEDVQIFALEKQGTHPHTLYLWMPCCKPRHAWAVKLELLKSWSLKIDHSRALCDTLGADQKTHGLWEQKCSSDRPLLYFSLVLYMYLFGEFNRNILFLVFRIILSKHYHLHVSLYTVCADFTWRYQIPSSKHFWKCM